MIPNDDPKASFELKTQNRNTQNRNSCTKRSQLYFKLHKNYLNKKLGNITCSLQVEVLDCVFRQLKPRGCSSNGRALAQHARGTGIDTRHLQIYFANYHCMQNHTKTGTNITDVTSLQLFKLQIANDQFVTISKLSVKMMQEFKRVV